MNAKFLFLGTGGSMGVPIVTCECPVCTSTSPLNKRFRPSGLLTVDDKNFVIDVGPDFRDQALRYGIKHVDGILLTHTHYDHIGGIDEMRIFYFKQKRKKIPVLASKESFDDIKTRFRYLFMTKQADGSMASQFDFQLLEDDFGKTEFEGLNIEYMSYYQANMKVTGYRLGTFAYICDIREYDAKVVESLKGVETLVLSALRYTPSEVHFSLSEAVDFSNAVGAKRTFFTHVAHDLEHDETNEKLPRNMRLAYDGLEIELEL